MVAGETDKLRAVSYPFKNMRKLPGSFCDEYCQEQCFYGNNGVYREY